jgi:hypothetical protein
MLADLRPERYEIVLPSKVPDRLERSASGLSSQLPSPTLEERALALPRPRRGFP